MMLESISVDILKAVINKSLDEKGRRDPLHSLHRWWSRRFSAIYRFLLASYLFDEEFAILEALRNPTIMREKARNKFFFEPFMGGGTGLIEAAIAGWNVIGIDINPIAYKVVDTSLDLVRGKLKPEYFSKIIRVLDKALNTLNEIWFYNGKMVSYTLISRDRFPTHISTITKNKTKKAIALCPECYSIFETPIVDSNITCPYCEHVFELSIKPVIEVEGSLEIDGVWKALAIEVRDPSKKWKKEWISLLYDKDAAHWLKKAVQKAYEIAEDVKIELSNVWFKRLSSTKRLEKIGIKNASQLFTYRQLASYKVFLEEALKVMSRKEMKFVQLAISESTKSASILAKWHPPIGEPVPAVALKAYWVPYYTVETNPLAHKPGTLHPLARNSLASTIRKQKRAYDKLALYGFSNNINVKIMLGDAIRVRFPSRFDLAVVDPPYMDIIDSYASLSFLHYLAFYMTEKILGINFVRKRDLDVIDKREIPRDREKYGKFLEQILKKLQLSMDTHSRIILMYNRPTPEDWRPVIEAIKQSELNISAIYWVLGETPGKLGRSKLRGIFLIILSQEKKTYPRIVFQEVLMYTNKFIKLNLNAERAAFEALKTALNL